MTDASPELAHPFHDGGEIHLDRPGHPYPETFCIPGIERGARGADEGFGWDATDIEAIAAQQMLLDERDFGAQPGGPRGGDEPGCAGADDHEIITWCRRGIGPIRRVDLSDKFLVVAVPRRDKGLG